MEASAARRPARPAPRIPSRLLRLASDDRLVEYVRAGSEPAFEAVFDRHHRGILAFCRHMLGSAEEAEDAVQHTFMAAYRSLGVSSRPIQLRPWLYTIARNRCLSVLRARREHPVDDLGELPTENLSMEVQRREDLRDLLRDVAELPEEQRAALVLAEVGGVSHDEIAQVLEVPREKVKALVFQARSSLIASRDARETSCEEIRVQLAQLRGGALRRNTLRRHLRSCAGCRDFRAALNEQRKLLALALPVVPTLALKQGVMGSVLGSGAAAGSAAAVGGAAAGGSLLGGGATVTAKVLAVCALAGGGAASVKAIATDERPVTTPPAPAAKAGGKERGGAVAGDRARRRERGGSVAPAAVTGGPQERERAARREPVPLSEQRSAGRRGVEQRSERATENAAGPQPETALRPEEKGVHIGPLERRGERGPGQAETPGPRAEQVQEPRTERPAGPAPTPRAVPESRRDGGRQPEPTPEAEPTPVAGAIATIEPEPSPAPQSRRESSGKPSS